MQPSSGSPAAEEGDVDFPRRARDDTDVVIHYGSTHNRGGRDRDHANSHRRRRSHSQPTLNSPVVMARHTKHRESLQRLTSSRNTVSDFFGSPHLPTAPLVDLRFDGFLKPKPKPLSSRRTDSGVPLAQHSPSRETFSEIPLLKIESSLSTHGEEVDGNASPSPITLPSALMNLFYLAAPAAVTIGFTFCTSIIPLAFVGKLRGERELTGASVGFFLLCIFVQYPMMGLSYAIDTLCSHEFGRRGSTGRLGLILQRGVLINSIILFPLCIGIYMLGPLLIHFYGVEVARVAEEFLYYSPLYLYALITLVSFSKFLNNQQKAYIPTMALTAGVLVTPLVQYKLTMHGIRYTMLGMAITTWIQVVVMLVITLSMAESREALAVGDWSLSQILNTEDFKTYMSYGLPSALFVAAEASALDLSILLGASYGEAQGSAWSAIMNTIFLFAALAGGISTSACANIGRCIGANDPVSAKRFVVISICVVITIAALDSFFIVAFFDKLLAQFGTTPATIELAKPIRYLLPALHIADAVQYTFQGIFSGLGQNHIGAALLLSSVWVVGIPLAFFFGSYCGFGIFGVCLGITIGFWIEAPLMITVATCYTDYNLLCELYILQEGEEEEMEEEEDDDDEFVV